MRMLQSHRLLGTLLGAATIVACQDTTAPQQPNGGIKTAGASRDALAADAPRIYKIHGKHGYHGVFVFSGSGTHVTFSAGTGAPIALSADDATKLEAAFAKAQTASDRADAIEALFGKTWRKMGLPDVDDAPDAPRSSSRLAAPPVATSLATYLAASSSIRVKIAEVPAPTNDYCNSLYLMLYADTQTLRADQYALGYASNALQNCNPLSVFGCFDDVTAIIALNASISVDYEYLNSDANQISWMGC